MSFVQVPLKHLAMLNPETLGEDTVPYRSFRYIDIATTGRGVLLDEPTTMTFEASPSRARRVLRPGDTILSTVRTYLRAGWTLRGLDHDLVASTGFVCLRPRANVDPRFLGWLAQADTVVEEVVARSVGVSYPAINPSDVGRIKVPCPPLSTQRAIADYLDRETVKIDELIAAKQRMVELLEERFSTWRDRYLDTLPALTVPLGRFVASIGQGVSPEAEDRIAGPGEWAVLKLSAVKSGRYLPLEQKALPPTFAPRPDLVPRAGDLLVTRSNTPLLVGDVCAVTVPEQHVMLSDLIYVLRLRTGLDPQYAAQALLTRRSRLQLASTARGTSQSMVKLRSEDVRATVIRVPDIDDQQHLVAEITQERQRVDRLIEVLRKQTALLQERRQALIAAAVTGQLDIPGAT